MTDGVYPRVNSTMLSTGQYTDQLLSMVGNVIPGGTAEQCQFTTGADQAPVLMNTTQMESTIFDLPSNLAVEIVGQGGADGSVIAFVCRTLGENMDLEIYNKMLQLQNDPNFAQYFVAAK